MTKKTTDQDETKIDQDGDQTPVTPPADVTPTTPPEPTDVTIASETPTDPPAQPEPIAIADAEAVVYRFSGTGSIAGVPTRDLTRLDVERLVPEQIRAMVVAAPGRSPIYEVV